MIDQDRHRLAEVGRGFAARQQHVVTVKRREGQTIARQIFRRHQAIRLQVVPQQRKIDPFEQPIGFGDAQNAGVRLFLRPVRHVHRAYIAREHLLPHDLGAAVDTETDAFGLRIPVG